VGTANADFPALLRIEITVNSEFRLEQSPTE
jgi:hypothetical protein